MTQSIWIIAFNCSLWSCFSWQKYNQVTEILVYKERVVVCPQILQLNTTSISFLLEAVTAWSVKNWFQRASHSWTTFPWSHWPKTQMQYFCLICFREPWSGNTSLECYPETTERNTSSTVYAEQIHMLLVTLVTLAPVNSRGSTWSRGLYSSPWATSLSCNLWLITSPFWALLFSSVKWEGEHSTSFIRPRRIE